MRILGGIGTVLILCQLCWAWPRADYSPGKKSMGLTSSSIARMFWDKKFFREPTCDELRALWRLSVRNSHTTEFTNELPTYRDPFAYSKISARYLPRGVAGNAKSRELWTYVKPSNHVYGKVVHSPAQDNISHGPERKVTYATTDADFYDHQYDDILLNADRDKAEVYRLPDGSISIKKIPALKNSFNALKEVVRRQRKKQALEDELAERERALLLGQSLLRPSSPYPGLVGKSNGDRTGYRSALLRQLTDGQGRPITFRELSFLAYNHLLDGMYDKKMFMYPVQVISNMIPKGII